MATSIPMLFDPRRRLPNNLAAHDFLHREAQARIDESLEDIAREFPHKILLGPSPIPDILPYAPHTADAVIAIGGLHWVNDLIGTLIQIRQTLKPDGVFLALLAGADTLRELRDILVSTEAELSGGARPRVAPFLEVREAGALLQRAGFSLPVVSSETLRVTYPDMFALMRDLRGMGETNLLRERPKHFTRRDLFIEAAARYSVLYPDGCGGITASFEFLQLSGWSPAANQQQPARRGSGKISLSEII